MCRCSKLRSPMLLVPLSTVFERSKRIYSRGLNRTGLTDRQLQRLFGDGPNWAFPITKAMLSRGHLSRRLDIQHLLNPGRFTDGTFGVFYGARHPATSAAELGYHTHLRSPLIPGEVRTLMVWAIRADCSVFDLHHLSDVHWQIKSPGQDGYPFCRELAQEARRLAAHGFETPSARDKTGTCTPVWHRPGLGTSASLVGSVYFFISDTGVQHELTLFL